LEQDYRIGTGFSLRSEEDSEEVRRVEQDCRIGTE